MRCRRRGYSAKGGGLVNFFAESVDSELSRCIVEPMKNNDTNTNTNDGSTIVSALEAAWTDIRKDFPELPERVLFITGVGSRKNAVVRGHWRQTGWRTETEGDLPELFISGERLHDGGRGVMTTLIHEAVHALAAARNVKDTSRQGRYHNKRFAALAEEMGLAAPENPDQVLGFSDCKIRPTTADRFAESIKQIDTMVKANVPNPFANFERGIALVLGMMRIWGWDIEGERGEAAHNEAPGIETTKAAPKRRSGVDFKCDCTTVTIPARQADSFNATCNECGHDFNTPETIANAGDDF